MNDLEVYQPAPSTIERDRGPTLRVMSDYDQAHYDPDELAAVMRGDPGADQDGDYPGPDFWAVIEDICDQADRRWREYPRDKWCEVQVVRADIAELRATLGRPS